MSHLLKCPSKLEVPTFHEGPFKCINLIFYSDCSFGKMPPMPPNEKSNSNDNRVDDAADKTEAVGTDAIKEG